MVVNGVGDGVNVGAGSGSRKNGAHNRNKRY